MWQNFFRGLMAVLVSGEASSEMQAAVRRLMAAPIWTDELAAGVIYEYSLALELAVDDPAVSIDEVQALRVECLKVLRGERVERPLMAPERRAALYAATARDAAASARARCGAR